LFPLTALISESNKIYVTAIKQLEKVFLPLLKVIRRVGQSQLLRRNLSLVLRFGSQLDAHQLHCALATFNLSLLSDVRREDEQQQQQHSPLDHDHERAQPTPTPVEQQAINKKTEKLLYETTALLDATGLDDPLHKVYCTSSPIEKLPELLFLFVLYWLPKVLVLLPSHTFVVQSILCSFPYSFLSSYYKSFLLSILCDSLSCHTTVRIQ